MCAFCHAKIPQVHITCGFFLKRVKIILKNYDFVVKSNTGVNMDIKDIKHLAELSKLEYTDEELVEFIPEFESAVELANIIKNADISGEIKYNVMDFSELRDDVAKESTPVDELLANSPIVRRDSMVVPRIME